MSSLVQHGPAQSLVPPAEPGPSVQLSSPCSPGWAGSTQRRAQVVGAATLQTPGLAPGALMRHFPRLAWLCALSYKAAQRGLWHLAGEGMMEGQG